MSGGSYDYLYLKDASQLVHMEEQIQQMADRLSGLGYAKDAARETQALLLNVRQAQTRLEVAAGRLHSVWHAVEYWDSGDSGEGDVKEALKDFRS